MSELGGSFKFVLLQLMTPLLPLLNVGPLPKEWEQSMETSLRHINVTNDESDRERVIKCLEHLVS